jgi:hypothetical protein
VWVSPGAVLASVIWLAASLGFKYYVAHFATYTETYGALGGVMVLLLWFYLSGVVLLLGAELNAEIEPPRHTGRQWARKCPARSGDRLARLPAIHDPPVGPAPSGTRPASGPAAGTRPGTVPACGRSGSGGHHRLPGRPLRLGDARPRGVSRREAITPRGQGRSEHLRTLSVRPGDPGRPRRAVQQPGARNVGIP